MGSSWNKTHCDRCGADLALTASIMSKFNFDALCMECKEDERLAPGYQAADDAEVAAVKARVSNFRGVGLSAQDRIFLAERRRVRADASVKQLDTKV